MAEVHWKTATNGDFAKPKAWVGNSVPGAADDALLNAVGAAFTVTSSANETVYGIDLAANANLAITGGTFTASAGTDGGVNAGTISVANGGTFDVGGVIDNTGTIALATNSANPAMYVVSNATLVGGGHIVLGISGTFSSIQSAQGVVLTNLDNTLSGQGYLGNSNDFRFVNSTNGVIDVNQYAPDFFSIGSYRVQGVTITNDGIIEAGSAFHASIIVKNATLNGNGGRLISQISGAIYVEKCQVSGQTIINQGGLININQSAIDLGGNISNSGQIEIISSAVNLVQNIILSGGGGVLFEKKEIWLSANSKITITNVDNVFMIEGALRTAKFSLINESSGVISDHYPFRGPIIATIDTGRHTIVNAGRIQTSVGGDLAIDSPVDNTGQIIAIDGTLTLNAAVTGSGVAAVVTSGGVARLNFTSSFNEAVNFQGPNCVLGLAHSQGFTSAVTGFSSTGSDSFDLGDIGFVGAGEATFSGTVASGVLTVTDGTHTANITLVGDYASNTFVASSDGHGGTIVVSRASPSATIPPHTFVSAMAALGATAGEASHFDKISFARDTMLAGSRAMTA